MFDTKTIEGRTLKNGSYRILEPIGSGTTGNIFIALQESTRQKVAVKILRKDSLDTERITQKKATRFKREMEICVKLCHPHIVRVIDFGTLEDDTLFTVFEYIPGITLGSLLAREGALPLQRAKNILVQILEAMKAAHDAGIIHRDLKPDNIMIVGASDDEQVKILDFGISAVLPTASFAATKVTLTREFIGTPAYSAPEQLRGEPVTFKSDLFSWGLIAIECLTGVPAYRENSTAGLIQQMLSKDPVPLPPGLKNHSLGSILAWILEKDPQRRAGDTSQVIKRLIFLELSTLPTLKGFFHDERNAVSLNERPAHSQSAMPLLERKQLTVLSLRFCFEAIDHRDMETDLHDEMLLETFESFTTILKAHGGFIGSRTGDSLQCCFGYPVVNGNETKKAALAALNIALTCTQRNILLEVRYGIRIRFSAGIHTGMVPIRKDSDGTTLFIGTIPSVAMVLSAIATGTSIYISERVYTILKLSFDCNVEGDCFTLHGERSTESMITGSVGKSDFFSGRSLERSLLQQHLNDACTPLKGNGVLVTGEAGIGKSRLVSELLSCNPQWNWIELRCTEESSNSALSPVINFFLRDMASLSASNAQQCERRLEEKLAQSTVDKNRFISLFMYWIAASSDNYPPLNIAPIKQKQLFVNLLARFFSEYSTSEHAVIIIEDLHWADEITVEFITELLDVAQAQGVFVILTTRPSFSRQWPRSLVREIVLDRLTDEEVNVLIENHSPVKFTNTITRQIVDKADGNPLYALELITSMVYYQQSGECSHSDSTTQFIIPDTLRDLLAQRLDMVGMAKETAQIASIIGRWFDYDLLAKISLRDEGTLLADLDQLVSSGLIHAIPKQGGLSYAFHHALVRDITYQSLASAMRLDLHHRIATILETNYRERIDQQPGILAQHWAAAGNADKAIEYCIRAARTALEKSSFGDTIYYSEMALHLLPDSAQKDSANTELTINSNYIQAMMSVYGWADERVRANAERSRILLKQCTDQTMLVPTLWILATYHHVGGNRTDVRSVVNELETICRNADDRGLYAATKTISGISHWIDGKYRQSYDDLTKAIEYYDPVKHRNHGLVFGLDSKVWALAGLANVTWFREGHKKALAIAREGVHWAEEINHVPSLGIALMYLAFLHHYNRDKESVKRVTDRMLTLAQEFGLPAVEGYGFILNCWSRGDYPAASATVDVLRTLGCNLGLSYISVIPAEIEADKSNVTIAIEIIDNVITLAGRIHEPYFIPELLYRKAEFILMDKNRSRIEEARDLLKEVKKVSEHSGMPITHNNADMLLHSVTQ